MAHRCCWQQLRQLVLFGLMYSVVVKILQLHRIVAHIVHLELLGNRRVLHGYLIGQIESAIRRDLDGGTR